MTDLLILATPEAADSALEAGRLSVDEEREIAEWHDKRMGYNRPLEAQAADWRELLDAAEAQGSLPAVRRPLRGPRITR